ncbi:DUF2125 domain-containing protein [Agrobacterium sp. ES01]|uniref:DUF2125 domain-containing protein n=1 Tax=Agrobacterium sp. ES01 TaxID=3420714 RepID=UPI003D11C9B0
MAMPDRSKKTTASRKVFRLSLAVLVALLLYSGGWYWAATALDGRLAKIFGTKDTDRANVECADRQLRGFPFRIGLFCTSIAIDDHRNGISASFGNFRSAAQVYNPGKIVWELDGPGQVRSTAGYGLSLQWEKLRSSVVSAIAGIDRSSLEVENLSAALTTTQSAPTLDMAVSHLESHIRQDDGNLDYAATVRDVQLSSRESKIELPKFSATLEATLDGQASLLNFGGANLSNLYGLQGNLTRLVADLGDGRMVTLSGPISIGDTGLLSGKIHVEVENITGLASETKLVWPDAANDIDNAMRMLSALMGGNKGNVDLRIDNGAIFLGLFPIGKIPPI